MVNQEPFMSFDNQEYFGNIVRSCLDARDDRHCTNLSDEW